MSDAHTPGVLVTHQLLHRTDPDEFATEIGDRLSGTSVLAAGSAVDTADELRTAEIATGVSVSEGALADAEALEWFHATTAGVDHLPLDALEDRGVVVTGSAGIHAEPAAEQVLAYLLAFERGLPRAFERRDRREFRHWIGGELRGKTLGIIGLGEIGARVAELGGAFGMTVVGTKRDPSTAPDAVDETYGATETQVVCAEADSLVLSCPLTDETRGLIGEPELASLSTDAVLVNVARGPVVDEPALVEALQRGEIAGAALDVFETEPLPPDSPLWTLSNVILTPHTAGSTPKYWARCADLFVRNYEHYVDDELDAMANRVI